jgi:hypothetical protein
MRNRNWGMAQVEDLLVSKYEALSSNLSTAKEKKKTRQQGQFYELEGCFWLMKQHKKKALQPFAAVTGTIEACTR